MALMVLRLHKYAKTEINSESDHHTNYVSYITSDFFVLKISNQSSQKVKI